MSRFGVVFLLMAAAIIVLVPLVGAVGGLVLEKLRARKARKAAAQRDPSCVFCKILDGQWPPNGLYDWPDAMAFTPLNPIVPGHLLVIPRVHVANAESRPDITAAVMRRAAEYARDRIGPCNILTSVGAEATQSVFHLHIHIVPRKAGDGLTLSWTGQQTKLPAKTIEGL